MRDFFNLYYQATQSKYFDNLGIMSDFVNGEKLNASKIKREIKSIVNSHLEMYPELKADTKLLLFENECVFAKTFLIMVKKMVFQRNDHR